MNSDPVYPGTPQQKALLKATVHHYADDPRILAVAVFGSLGRGNWDQYSDLDLDIVIADDAGIEPLPELKRLCTSFEPLGERALIIVPDGGGCGRCRPGVVDGVVSSLSPFAYDKPKHRGQPVAALRANRG
jgi:hypothetical protein